MRSSQSVKFSYQTQKPHKKLTKSENFINSICLTLGEVWCIHIPKTRIFQSQLFSHPLLPHSFSITKILFSFLHSKCLNVFVVFPLIVFSLHRKPYFLLLVLTPFSLLFSISLFLLSTLCVKELLTFSLIPTALYFIFSLQH